ncbi:MAG: WhiB family transcriptional regulator [Actinomycetes bacterium]
MSIDLDPTAAGPEVLGGTDTPGLDLPSLAAAAVLGDAATAVAALGACRNLGPALFFSDELDDIIAAKRLCQTCPVRSDCLSEAVARGERYGIWGGQLFEEGRIVLSKRRKGRPPRVPRPEDVLPEIEVPESFQYLVQASAN